MRSAVFIATVLTAVVASHIHGDDSLPPWINQQQTRDSEFDETVKTFLQIYHVPGLSMAIIDNDQIYAKGYGYARLPSTRATADTLYFTGSTTKAFTGAAAAVLVKENSPKITWRSSLNKLLPKSFALPDNYTSSHTTLEDSLSHRSGLPRHDLAYGWNNASVDDVVRSMAHLPLTELPRSRWQYCNLMVGTAGHSIEKLTSKKLEHVLKEWFWEPLGMKSTMFSLQAAHDMSQSSETINMARGYYFVNKRDETCHSLNAKDFNSYAETHEDCYYVPDVYMDIMPIAGAGATISTVKDYGRWIRALLDLGRGKREINPTTKLNHLLYKEMMTPRAFLPPDEDMGAMHDYFYPPYYSLGWIVDRLGPYKLIYHPGGLPGFGTEVFLLPEMGLGFVSMGNTMLTSNFVGQQLFLEVLKRRLSDGDGFNVTELVEQSMTMKWRESSKNLSLGPKLWSHGADIERVWPKPEPGTASITSKHLKHYVGIYEHPGYGRLNISILNTKTDSPLFQNDERRNAYKNQQNPLFSSPGADSSTILLVEPSVRMWQFGMTLEHREASIFHIKLFLLFGAFRDDPVDFSDQEDCGPPQDKDKDKMLDCKREAAWQDTEDETQWAIFEDGDDGNVERLGIEMEEEMVRATARDGLDWKEGVIWFKKIA